MVFALFHGHTLAERGFNMKFQVGNHRVACYAALQPTERFACKSTSETMFVFIARSREISAHRRKGGLAHVSLTPEGYGSAAQGAAGETK